MEPTGGLHLLDHVKKQLGNPDDLEYLHVKTDKAEMYLLYIKSLCEENLVTEQVITPFFHMNQPSEFLYFLSSIPNSLQYDDAQEIVDKIMDGYVCVTVSGSDRILLISMAKVTFSKVSEATVEPIIQGPKDALTQNITTNINMIRYRYQSPDLMIETSVIGKKSKTKIALIFDKKLADIDEVNMCRQKLMRINEDIIQSSGEIQRNFLERKTQLFPTMLFSERPDRVVRNLSIGKIVVLIDTTSFAGILPASFYEFFHSMDDYIQLPVVGWFLIIIRYIGFLISTITPALYVALTGYNPEVFHIQMTLSIAGSRVAIPLPAFLEVLFMLLMTELLLEASVRLPRSIGPTATTVGGLILGQAATEAGLVSNIMIIIVSAVAISNFVMPITYMFFSVRVLKYIFLLIAILFGLTGIIVTFNFFIFYLASIYSFGRNFLAMFPEKQTKSGAR